MREKLLTDNEKICRAKEGELEFETPWGTLQEGEVKFSESSRKYQTPIDTMANTNQQCLCGYSM